MKKKYTYKIGDIVDDLECINIIPSKKGSGKNCRFLMKCTKCGREKSMIGACIHQHKGTTHKACGKGLKTKDQRFHSLWRAMRTRTTNPNYEHWDSYGGRGINSDEFEYFIDFYDSMYKSYKKACKKYGEKNVSLERKNVDGNYCVDNCTWIHIDEQKGNKQKTVYFELTYPDGTVIKGKNINKYAEENKLDSTCLYDLINGKLKTYKGIKGKRIDKSEV